jgi:YidC/Oxa1 family membrane protein insertase
MLAQIPVFFALYLELRHFARNPPSGSLSWLHIVPNMAKHAGSHWSGYLLLAIYAISQMASTYFMSATMEKTQRYLMMVLPLFFITFLVNFPVGLVIYWVTTNLWTVGQGLITRRLVPKTPAPQLARRTSRTPPKDDGDGNGAKKQGPQPKPAPAAQAQQRPRQQQVRRKKKKGGARR